MQEPTLFTLKCTAVFGGLSTNFPQGIAFLFNVNKAFWFPVYLHLYTDYAVKSTTIKV